MVDCLHRAMRPASRPVITPLIVDPMMIVTIIGRASAESQADAPSSAPSAAPSRTPSNGLLTVTLECYSTRQARTCTRHPHDPPLITVHNNNAAAISPLAVRTWFHAVHCRAYFIHNHPASPLDGSPAASALFNGTLNAIVTTIAPIR